MNGVLVGTCCGFVVAAVLASRANGDTNRHVTLQSTYFQHVISLDGRNVEFRGLATGKDYLRTSLDSRLASVTRDGVEYPVTALRAEGNQLCLQFSAAEIEARVKVEPKQWGVMLAVESVRGDPDSIVFVNVPLSLKGSPKEEFGACALALSLNTRVDSLPALQSELRASAEKRFGIVGAKVAIVAGPVTEMLRLLREAISSASDLPVCRVAGPWAHDAPFNKGSYLFNFGSLTETNIAEWIEMVQRVGFDQVDNHGGGSFFRFGDFELNPDKWPHGWDSFARIVSKLHEAGIGSIFHTYAFFIDKRSKYVTPVPDKRLDAFRVFTLTEPISAEATEIVVNESTANVSSVTGFFEHNSVVLHIDDELVTFSGATKQPPWRFTGVKRGAFGTKTAPHDRGAKARHLKECFGLFVPDVDTTLFEEIAKNHADIVNRCGFDGIYLDAIDGSSILRGPDQSWYWAGKFVVEIQKRLTKPVGMEMSAMWHHFWQYRTRWQAWDFPQRGHKRFIDLHAEAVNSGMLLPLHLGWWGFQSFSPPQVEPTYPDVMEHLAARLVGFDAGISLTAPLDTDTLKKKPLFARAAQILQTAEKLRRNQVFTPSARQTLRDMSKQFRMVKRPDGTVTFQQVEPHAQTVTSDEPWSSQWKVTNAFGQQPLKCRIEALISAAPLESGNHHVLADLAHDDIQRWTRTSAAGVTFAVEKPGRAEDGLATIIVTNRDIVPRNAAWIRLEKKFDPPLNAHEHKALRFEVQGDGNGTLLAVRLQSPKHTSYGAIADRYLPLDFTGRRKITLVETESSRWSDYVWNDGKHMYNVYRETIDFGAIESVELWLISIPPNSCTTISVGPVYAVPLVVGCADELQLTVNDQTITFPARLESGCWLEADGPTECTVYGQNGETLGKVTPRGRWPQLENGVNDFTFKCRACTEHHTRIRVTVYAVGSEI